MVWFMFISLVLVRLCVDEMVIVVVFVGCMGSVSVMVSRLWVIVDVGEM